MLNCNYLPHFRHLVRISPMTYRSRWEAGWIEASFRKLPSGSIQTLYQILRSIVYCVHFSFIHALNLTCRHHYHLILERQSLFRYSHTHTCTYVYLYEEVCPRYTYTYMYTSTRAAYVRTHYTKLRFWRTSRPFTYIHILNI